MMFFEWHGTHYFVIICYNLCCFLFHLCGSHALLDISHVALLCFVGFWEKLLDGTEGQMGPSGKIAGTNGLDPRGFSWKTCACMEVSHNLLGGW